MTFLSDRFDMWDESYLKIFLFKIAMIIIIIGSLNWLIIGICEFNPVEYILGDASRLIYILVGLSALLIMFNRNTYLPFLGPMVIPSSVLQPREPPGATKDVQIVVTPHTKIIYWAAEPKDDKIKKLVSWKDAYQHYENAGVTISNGEGMAILKVREPQAYKVPFVGQIQSHIHYRVCRDDGFMDEVRTVYVNPSGPDGFENQGYAMF